MRSINKVQIVGDDLYVTNLDLDYIETLIRERFLFGKEEETIYIIKNDEIKN